MAWRLRRPPWGTGTEGAASQALNMGTRMHAATMIASSVVGAGTSAAAAISPPHNSAVRTVDAHVIAAWLGVGWARANTEFTSITSQSVPSGNAVRLRTKAGRCWGCGHH